MSAPQESTRPATPDSEPGRPQAGWRLALYTVIFESDTRAGRLFDIGLIVCILASVGVVMLDSQPVTRTCPECLTEGHVPQAHYCLHCGAALPPLRDARDLRD